MRWIFISQLYNPLDEFLLVEPCVHAVFGQAGPCGESADGVAVRVGVAEEDFEGALGLRHLVCDRLDQPRFVFGKTNEKQMEICPRRLGSGGSLREVRARGHGPRGHGRGRL